MNFYKVLASRLCIAILLASIVLSSQVVMELPKLEKLQDNAPKITFSVKNKEYFKYEFDEAIISHIDYKNSSGVTTNDCKFFGRSVQLNQVHHYTLNYLESNRMGNLFSDIMAVKSENLVYTITNGMSITAYEYSQDRIKKVRQIDLNVPDLIENVDSRAILRTNSDQTALYVFSRYGAWVINPKTVLENIKSLGEEYKVEATDSAVLGENIILVGPSLGLQVYKVQPDYKLKPFSEVKSFNYQDIIPFSVSVDPDSGIVYVLDQSRGIYVCMIHENSISVYDVIEIQHPVNYNIRTESNRIFYSFMDMINEKVAELSYDVENKKATLVRYYKMFDNIYDMKLIGGRLIALNQESIEILPTNIDPRLIVSPHNGVRLRQKARRMVQVAQDMFILADYKSLKLSHLRELRDRIECRFETEHHTKVLVTYAANATTCNNWPKRSFNTYCQVKRVLEIDVDTPQEIEWQRTFLYSIVIAVFVLFLVGVVCLIQWRNGRLDLIDKLAHEIRELRTKDRKTVPFTQENQIEIPQIIEDKPQDRAVEANHA